MIKNDGTIIFKLVTYLFQTMIDLLVYKLSTPMLLPVWNIYYYSMDYNSFAKKDLSFGKIANIDPVLLNFPLFSIYSRLFGTLVTIFTP